MADAGIFFNPRTDYGFKLLFGQEESKDFLIHFLNGLFEGEHIITDVVYRDKEQLGRTEDERNAIYDIYCTTNHGKHLIIEMQNARQINFLDRCAWYLSRAVVNQNIKGRWDFKIEQVIGIFFMNFEIPETKGRLVTPASFKAEVDEKDSTTFLTFPKAYFINLLEAKKIADFCETDTERWTNIIKYMETMTSIPFTKSDARLERLTKGAENIWKKLQEFATIHNFSREQLEAYEDSLNAYRDAIAVHKAAIEDGRAIGIEEGRAQGRAEGHAEGRAEGEKETIRGMILKLNHKGFDAKDIAQMLDMTFGEVEKVLLKKE